MSIKVDLTCRSSRVSHEESWNLPDAMRGEVRYSSRSEVDTALLSTNGFWRMRPRLACPPVDHTRNPRRHQACYQSVTTLILPGERPGDMGTRHVLGVRAAGRARDRDGDRSRWHLGAGSEVALQQEKDMLTIVSCLSSLPTSPGRKRAEFESCWTCGFRSPV